ncbi:hypothetical protein CI238_07306, partial [Colletotrichum incanum]
LQTWETNHGLEFDKLFGPALLATNPKRWTCNCLNRPPHRFIIASLLQLQPHPSQQPFNATISAGHITFSNQLNNLHHALYRRCHPLLRHQLLRLGPGC